MSKISVLNVPSDVGSIYSGKSRAPAALRSAGLQQKLEAAGWDVSEIEAFKHGPRGWASSSRAPNGARNEQSTVEACRDVRSAVTAALQAAGPKSHALPFQLILSGECLYCPAILSAYWHHLAKADKRVGLIYMDADCDLGTATDEKGTGNIAGMTLTHLTLSEGSLDSMRVFSRPDGAGVVDATNIVLFGLNMQSPANQRSQLGYLFDNQYRVHTSAVVQHNPAEEAKRALRWMESQVDYIVVHLDVDVIDPGEFPLCNVPSYTGLEFNQVMAALNVFLRSDRTIGLSLAEVNPDHDPNLTMTKQLVDALVNGLDAKKVT